MKLPEKISDAIQGNSNLMATVSAAIDALEPIISSRPFFFPEYTDHGPVHNQEVLQTALGLLSEEAFEKLSSADYAALTLAVLLHDSGMHLTGESFIALISPSNQKLTDLDKVTWNELWREFLLEAKRFDGRQLKSIFGSSDPIEEPPADSAEYTLKHRLLIGEFLRRHHPRLSHEISLFGFPSSDGCWIPIVREGAGDLAEISGILARSHGMPLRRACDIFDERYHQREYQTIHPPILMAALRIADYLQIQPERAPKTILRLRKLKSPFYEGEWRVHQSVRNITPADDDPEAIYVDAKPDTVETFIKFERWALSFQSELDSTWAALGEVYGRFSAQGYDKFTLKLRRLRTSIDNLAEFSKSVPYVPAKIAFDASSPDLLSLLVAPLYGDKPEVGLRELIQNSLDSVLEREFIQGDRLNEKLNGIDADVVVYPVIEEDSISKVVIEDRGIGMSADIIRNYFLRAGASFRTSPQWKKSFTSQAGESEIARTGRFGIGALAGFLLGSDLEVETRRLGHSEGVIFRGKLEDESIELKRLKRPVGTKITIKVDEHRKAEIEQLFYTNSIESKRWDWYCNKHPRLVRIGSSDKELDASFVYSENDQWVSLSTQNYSEIKWRYKHVAPPKYSSSNVGKLYCNGIFVCDINNNNDDQSLLQEDSISPDIELLTPTVLVTDKGGNLPVNLQRNGLSGPDAELSRALRLSMARELVAQAIAFAPEHFPFTKKGYVQMKNRVLSCRVEQRWRYTSPAPLNWCWEDRAWSLADAGTALKKKHLLIMHTDLDACSLQSDPSLLDDVSVIWQEAAASPANQNELREYFRWVIFGNKWSRSVDKPVFDRLPVELFYSRSVHEKLLSGSIPKYLATYIDQNIIVQGDYVCLRSKLSHPINAVLQREMGSRKAISFGYTMIGGTNSSTLNEDHILKDVWSHLVGKNGIPLDYEERRIAHPVAFKELGDRIDYYRRIVLAKGEAK